MGPAPARPPVKALCGRAAVTGWNETPGPQCGERWTSWRVPQLRFLTASYGSLSPCIPAHNGGLVSAEAGQGGCFHSRSSKHPEEDLCDLSEQGKGCTVQSIELYCCCEMLCILKWSITLLIWIETLIMSITDKYKFFQGAFLSSQRHIHAHAHAPEFQPNTGTIEGYCVKGWD